MSTTANDLKSRFEQKIQVSNCRGNRRAQGWFRLIPSSPLRNCLKEANAVPEKPKKPQKAREWTPTNNGAVGAHNAVLLLLLPSSFAVNSPGAEAIICSVLLLLLLLSARSCSPRPASRLRQRSRPSMPTDSCLPRRA